jgi:hypothetical protein|tara:strand:- start:273 stop:578 length:306 start_codon:yes stop_codon:yes gene_type:complete
MPRRTQYIKEKINLDRKRYYKYVKYPEIPLTFKDIYVTTTSGDRLDNLANQFYNNVDLWWVITTANPDVIRRDSLNLKPGIEIRIPQDIESILEEFEKINE